MPRGQLNDKSASLSLQRADRYRLRQRLDTKDFGAALVAQLQAYVGGKLAPCEYPKKIESVNALRLATAVKLQRRVVRLPEEARAAQLQTPDRPMRNQNR